MSEVYGNEAAAKSVIAGIFKNLHIENATMSVFLRLICEYILCGDVRLYPVFTYVRRLPWTLIWGVPPPSPPPMFQSRW